MESLYAYDNKQNVLCIDERNHKIALGNQQEHVRIVQGCQIN